MSAWTGKVALISGASRGVGLALARALSGAGARVVISARGERRLREAEAELRAGGGEVLAVCGDVGVYEDAARMVDAAVQRFGRLDILVNNAGVSMRGRFDALDPSVCAQVVGTNLLGSMYLSRAAIEHVSAARGSIVFVSSIAGIVGLPGASAYCASKRALTGLAESLRLELRDRGVHVGVVHLGFTENDPEKLVLGADGVGVPPDRPAHHTQAYAAAAILRLIARRRGRRVMTPIGAVASLAHRISPALVEGAIRWAGRRNLGLYRRFS